MRIPSAGELQRGVRAALLGVLLGVALAVLGERGGDGRRDGGPRNRRPETRAG